MATINQQATEIMDNAALMMEIDNQMDADTATGLSNLSDVELFDLIADKTVAIRDAQVMISGASRLLQQRHAC